MILLHNIGNKPKNSNYNTIEEVKNSTGPISFDGVYRNVYKNIEHIKDRDVTLFVMGDYVGRDNSFDTKMPLEDLCTWDEIMYMVYEYGFKLGWHTWSHRPLTKLSDIEILKEITPPFYMKHFAYPYGKINDRVVELVMKAGYENAYCAGNHGDGTRFQLKRHYLK